MTTAENLSAVRDGRSGLRRYENPWGLPFAVCASLLSEEQNRSISQECANVDTTRFDIPEEYLKQYKCDELPSANNSASDDIFGF